MSDGGDFRTALATPSLLNIQKLLISYLCFNITEKGQMIVPD